MIEVVLNDRMGHRIRVKCEYHRHCYYLGCLLMLYRPTDTIGDLKKLAAAHLGTKAEKLVIKRQQYTILKDHISLEDYEIQDGSGLELYFQ